MTFTGPRLVTFFIMHFNEMRNFHLIIFCATFMRLSNTILAMCHCQTDNHFSPNRKKVRDSHGFSPSAFSVFGPKIVVLFSIL